jgi:SAM-dependent methyltransferase
LKEHEPTGARYSVRKCEEHRAQQHAAEAIDETYYANFGLVRAGRLIPTAHVQEMGEALGFFEPPTGSRVALEIGCGVSPYVPALVAAGWRYLGLDESPWACRFTWEVHGWPCVCESWESYQPAGPFGLILSAHCLEHVQDAPLALAKMAQSLEPGGLLYLLVPDDEQPLNPDHRWFFREESMAAMVANAGFAVEATVRRRYSSIEDFLYCRARKP